MRKFVGLTSALLMGVSTVALAQTTQTTPSVTSPSTTSNSSSSATGASDNSQFSPSMTEQQVKSYLEGQGYENISSLRKSSDGWTGEATQNGKKVNFTIDQTGQVQAQ